MNIAQLKKTTSLTLFFLILLSCTNTSYKQIEDNNTKDEVLSAEGDNPANF